MAQFKFSQKIELAMPKVEGKAETKKMQQAVNRALTRGAQKGASYVEKDLKTALDNSVKSQWAWTQGSRDIIDTGKLLNSLQIKTTFNQTKIGFQIIYRTRYAAFVHYGGLIKPYGNKNAADVLIPARPWVQAVLEGTHGQPKFDMLTPFDKGVSEVWTSQFG